MRYTKSTEPRKTIKLADMRRIEAEIAAAKGTPNYDVLLAKYTGPDIGIYYKEETGYLLIHSGWHVTSDGEVVKDN